MKKLLLLILPLLAITFNSCSSSDDDNGTGNQSKLVKQMDDGEMKYKYEYDTQDRPIKIIATDAYDGSKRTSTITYNSTKITVNSTYEGYSWTEVYTLDNNGYVIEMEYTDGDGDNYIEEYTYTDGYWTKVTYGDGDYSTFTWNNGNRVNVQSVGSTNNDYYDWPRTTTYTDKLDKMSVNWFYSLNYSHLKLKGTYSKNLPLTIEHPELGSTTYEYTFDSDGYPTKVIETGSYDTRTTHITYY